MKAPLSLGGGIGRYIVPRQYPGVGFDNRAFKARSVPRNYTAWGQNDTQFDQPILIPVQLTVGETFRDENSRSAWTQAHSNGHIQLYYNNRCGPSPRLYEKAADTRLGKFSMEDKIF